MSADLLANVGRAAEEAAEWTVQRDEWIVAAVRAGSSQREVARAAGLSHTAVQAIVRRTTTRV